MSDKNPKLKYFSLFTGIGGLDYGLEEIGAECVGYSEIRESSMEIYRKHYPDHKCFGDITKIDYEAMPDFDVLTGGFPCQAFSLAGLRKGFEDHKGQMIFYIYELLKIKQPKYFVLENVKGILNHRGGKTLQDVFKLMASLGYFVRILLLNSHWYGSAQNRERVVFLGCKEDFPKKEVIKIDDTKRFRDIREDDDSNYKYPNITQRMADKIDGKLTFKFQFIGGYDQVGTLTTQFGCGEKLVQYGNQWRYLTPLECERLQNFPDGWTEGVKNVHRYFALGNAVNVNMSKYIFTNYLKGLWY